MTAQQTIKLKNSLLPKMMGDLMHSNQFLKVFSLCAMLLVFMTLALLMMMFKKEPLVITLAPNAKVLERVSIPQAEDQVREAIKRYLEIRYQWGPDTVVKKLKESEFFIQPTAIKAFQNSMANISKFSTEKIVSQRVYAEKVDVDLSKKVARVTGDRITSIQGLKAAGNLKLELTFENGERTKANPWGIYIAKEREE